MSDGRQRTLRPKGSKAGRNSEAIGIIDYVRFVSSQPTVNANEESDSREQSKFIWNQTFFESFRSGYLKKLDFATYRRLARPAARRAFRFLDKLFWQRPDWQFPLRTFACEKIGLSRAYDTGQLKARLKPALRELESLGFIETPVYTKERRGHWTIGVQQKQRTIVSNDSDSPTPTLVQTLTSRRVSLRMAKLLTGKYPSEQIGRNVEFFDGLVKSRDARVSTNPPGFLVVAIRDDIAASKKSGTAIGARPSAPTTPRQNRVNVELSNERKKFDAYWASLNDMQRKSLEAAAFESATPFLRDAFERAQKRNDDALVAVYRQAIVDCLIKKQCDA